MRAHLSIKSRNVKTGPIPVTTTESRSCPPACSLKDSSCYAAFGHVAMHWRAIDAGKRGDSWAVFCRQIAALPAGQLFRHNQAGDLPGSNNVIDRDRFSQLVAAAKGKRGFTYTHYPLTRDNAKAIAAANRHGIIVNLSADSLADADTKADAGVGPVVVVLPEHQTTATKTPAGRHVAICPATLSDSVTCESCQLCAMRDRKSIIGFPAHGAGKSRII